jgi:DNA polymerase III subunit delta
VKVKEVQIGRALDQPDGTIRLFLLYGPDDAGSHALAARLERAMGPDAERIDLDGATLKDDPARLADEAASFSLFGGKRHIRVTGGDECAAAVAALLETEAAENPVVLIAGNLKPSAALLKLALDHPAVMACQNFPPEGHKADDLAVQIGRVHGLRLGPGVAAALAANCLGDRAVLEREIEKLALYLDAAPDRPREATIDAWNAVGADLDATDTAALVDAVMNGDLTTATRELAEVETSGDWIPALRALQRRISTLARLRAEVEAGKSTGAVMAVSGKSLFWKEKDAVGAQLGRWNAARLATAHARLFASEGAMMASGTAGHVIVAEELIAIARVAERLR